MKRRRAAAPYAKALFELAKEGDEAELIGRELKPVEVRTIENLSSRA